MTGMKLAVGSPVYDGRAHVNFFRAYENIRAVMAGEGVEVQHFTAGQSANLPRLRNSIAARALDWGADAILWMDSDIAGSGADALKLWQSEKAIVGAAPQKRPMQYGEPASVAFKPLPDGKLVLRGNHVEVGSVATAFCLTRRSVFEALRANGVAKRLSNRDGFASEWFRNYFWYELEPAGEIEGEDAFLDDGEDYYFCRKAREAGFGCFIHTDVRPIHHEGSTRLPVNFMDVFGRHFEANANG